MQLNNKNENIIKINNENLVESSPVIKEEAIEIKYQANPNFNNQSEKSINNKEKYKKKESILSLKNKKPAGYLILLSGAIHNTMDGIALGITFASRKITVIISTNLAILFHEIPKEMGDAGILLNSKFNIWSVLFWNITNNITNVIGTIIGIGIGEISDATKAYSLAFIAGNFFYIALAEMVPEIMKRKGLYQQIAQFTFIIAGIGIMFLILLLE